MTEFRVRPSVVAIAIALAWSSSAAAQGSPVEARGSQGTGPTAEPGGSPDLQPEPAADAIDTADIIVTGSRIASSGFQQPTPVTVVGDTEIKRQAAPTIAQYLNQLPSFGVTTSAKNPAIQVAGGGTEFLNLRNLGATRTLVLLDNRRVVEATSGGGVDTVTLPLGLIKRVEVVTGGASAAWGSDAVAGVVNFILDRKYEGIGINGETGITQRGDAGYVKANLTAGTGFAAGRGHLVAEFDYFNQPNGVDLRERDWFNSRAVVNNPAFVAGNGQPRQITVSNVGTANISPGGVITSGPLRGTQFVGPNGTPAPYNFGNQSGLVQYGGDVDKSIGLARSISTPLNYANAFAHLDYELSSNITVYVEGFYGRSNYKEDGYLFFTRPGNLSISVDNPFLDSSVRAQLVAAGQTSFNLGKNAFNMGPPTSRNSRDVWRAVVGVDGRLGSTWQWHAYYTHGEVKSKLYADNNTIIANFLRAVDAVRDPSTGNIVCRSTLTAPTNGCVPYNPFGTGPVSDATIAYTHGTAFQRSEVKLDVFSVDASGSLLTLPAGDLSLAFGADYIRNKAFATQDDLALARAYAVQNFQPFSGQRDVKEVFAEIAVPIVRDVPLLQKLDLNAAARVTDYSTSGTVTTWKVGLTDQVSDSLRIRGTISRDIRAPTLDDLFTGGVIRQQPVFDSLTNMTYQQFTNQAGNPALEPERADTITAGVVYTPDFVPGLQISVDYYQIAVKGAIASLTAAQELALCNAGQTFYCQYINRDANQAIVSIDTVPVNVSSLKIRGWDFELAYAHQLGAGSLATRVLASYVPFFQQTDAIGNVTNFAGQVADLNPGQPKLKANATLTYEQGPLALTLTSRFVGPAKLQNDWVEGVDVDDNSVHSYLTFGLTAQLEVEPLTFTVGIDNLFDRDPIDLPVVPNTVQYGAPGIGGRFDLYDPLGRSFRFGVRAKF